MHSITPNRAQLLANELGGTLSASKTAKGLDVDKPRNLAKSVTVT